MMEQSTISYIIQVNSLTSDYKWASLGGSVVYYDILTTRHKNRWEQYHHIQLSKRQSAEVKV